MLSGYILSMLRIPARLAAFLAVGAVLAGATNSATNSAAARSAHVSPAAVASLDRSLNAGMRAAGNFSGAYVVDLSTGQVLYSRNARVGRLPASVEKVYTTSTALLRFGPSATLSTAVLGLGRMQAGSYTGTLYLRGGGDPTFGSAGFDHASYGTGATVQQLVANLISATGIKRLKGTVVADQSMFDSLRSTPATGYAPSIEVEGELGALSFNRGWANSQGSVFFKHPALEAAQQLVAAFRSAGIRVPRPRIRAGVAPLGSQSLAVVQSPSIATLVALTNAPSDNFFAETLLKDLGASFGGGGTTANGAAVVRATIANSFGLHPRLDDGSGLSRFDRTTPFQIVSLLRQQASDQPFTGSLAIAGRSGTLLDRMRGTYAQNRCRSKTGTLHDVSNLVGYCRAADGHMLAYALMMNGIYPIYAHPIQDRMAVAIAKYGG